MEKGGHTEKGKGEEDQRRVRVKDSRSSPRSHPSLTPLIDGDFMETMIERVEEFGGTGRDDER